MDRNGKALIIVMALCLILQPFLPATVSANSAEPPSIVILVNNPPKDLTIDYISGKEPVKASVRRAAWEGYFVFYSREMQVGSEYTFRASTKGESFEFQIHGPLEKYNNVFTLSLSSREVTEGTYPLRSILLVSIRLLLTLLIEGGIFWLFGYRKWRSWLIFLIINLITQGALNIWLSKEASVMSYYNIFGLIIGEFYIFAVEMIAFPVFIKEHKKSRSLVYAFTANLISLIVGGYIITLLPV